MKNCTRKYFERISREKCIPLKNEMYTQRVVTHFVYFVYRNRSIYNKWQPRPTERQTQTQTQTATAKIRNKFGMFGSIVSDLSGFQHFPFWATFIEPVNPESCAQKNVATDTKFCIPFVIRCCRAAVAAQCFHWPPVCMRRLAVDLIPDVKCCQINCLWHTSTMEFTILHIPTYRQIYDLLPIFLCFFRVLFRTVSNWTFNFRKTNKMYPAIC